jgi:hypothetical protein
MAGVVEDWSALSSGSTGAFQDSNGSKIEFAIADGPKGAKALKITANVVSGGYAGIYHTITADLSKSGSFKFMAQSTVAGDVQMAIVDSFGVQYVAKFSVATTWTEVNVSFASFIKDPYYTPAGAVLGHPIDWSKTTNLNFSPQITGASVVEIGPVESTGTPGATAGTAPATSPAGSSSTTASSPSSSASTGSGVQVLDFGSWDAKAGGTFQDSQGSTFAFATKDNPSKKGQKYLTITYELKQGGYCGMWCRTGGSDWKGVTLGSAKTISLMIYSKEPVVLGIALQDKNNNQYDLTLPSTKGGGKWETVTANLGDATLDAYYTPAGAKKGAPMDFSSVTNFNIQPKTAGKETLAVDNVVAK